MRCPFCRTALAETTQECPACRLTLARATSVLGQMPRLILELDDPERRLHNGSAKRVKAAIHRLHKRFPQITMQVTLRGFPAEHPFDLHIFWLFNEVMISGEGSKGGDNRSILLAVDPTRAEASLMVGYGLEPFLGQNAMDHLLTLAGPMLQRREWMEGILTILEGLERLLESASTETTRAFGLTTPVHDNAPGVY
jgi:hypothetical protein